MLRLSFCSATVSDMDLSRVFSVILEVPGGDMHHAGTRGVFMQIEGVEFHSE